MSGKGPIEQNYLSGDSLMQGSYMQTAGNEVSTASLKQKLIGPSTVHVDLSPPRSKRGSVSHKAARKAAQMMAVFPNDVKVEKKIKQADTNVSSRALETWINETLTDAYHLEIPGVIVKPEHKLPIFRYGIDRQTLVNSGVSPDEVDRIYRSLFVYSVGFFEFLKKILQSTMKNYQIITSIWKVYQVLLEYCCKTDYRILIAELTDRHHAEVE